GAEVIALPSGRRARIRRILCGDRDLPVARAGQSVTLLLASEIDLSRGDVLCAAASLDRPSLRRRLAARLLWTGERPHHPDRAYVARLGEATAPASIARIFGAIDLESMTQRPAD